MSSTHSIPLRQLGKHGPRVPAIGFGLMGLAGAYGQAASEDEGFQILDRAFELGETFWDTADIYRGNEQLIGKWFKQTGKRDEIFLASKGAIMMDGSQFKGVDSSGEYLKHACEKSLARLGVEYIDLYYAHRLNPNTPVEESMRALAELKTEGKIKHIGLCGLSSTALRRAVKIAPVAAVQIEYSPFVREVETGVSGDLAATCRELGVALVCYSPLGRGLLTGSVSNRSDVTQGTDMRAKNFPWFSEENLDANAKLVARFKELADKNGCSSSQLALAWLLAQGDNVFPIPGTRKIKYLEDNVKALDVTLTDEKVVEVREFLEHNELQGYHSVEQAKHFAYVDTKADA
ncbi:uncharacterized protein N0V89_009564 [Didymosphaeria variabile]|uniref:NADP-dependent oxidoreductase domain-containing protein n=1 Tax=Didymosphaeria variabile TaxID=1932322 RepID=A0A9W9C6P1_9PLEO|nr:uncharacterized protein N0V89_009564 [Didymosphaeria variabile]KAJ4348192.1 hypothetical protein N0V89_009564 [Didymosphaeria variabile]